MAAGSPARNVPEVRLEPSVADVTEQLRALGVRPGGVLLVHASYRAVRPVEGGPVGLIHALRAALGRDGTLVMPTMTDGERPFDPRDGIQGALVGH